LEINQNFELQKL